MIAIKGMEMLPRSCMNCRLLGREEMYCSIYPRRDLDVITVATNRPNWCPLVEIEERKVGKWEHDKLFECTYVCSFCHTIRTSSKIQSMRYCPTCGAEMVGVENE